MTAHIKRALAAAAAVLAILTLGHLVLMPRVARSQDRACGPLPHLDARLAAEYGERVAWAGALRRMPIVLRLYVNPATRSWTIVAVAPDGCAGAIDAGTHSAFVRAPAPHGQRGKPRGRTAEDF